MSVDLSTTYLGLNLHNPLVVSACPITGKVELIKELEQEGASAVVLPSLFEEQIESDDMNLHMLHEGNAHSFQEAHTYVPEIEGIAVGPSDYLNHISQSKKAVSIPVIASLNGDTPGGWTHYAKLIEEAGADAIELNIYTVATHPETTSDQIIHDYADLVAQVRQAVSIPLAVKIAPYFCAIPHLAMRLVDAGADGLVLFNRFLHLDIDLEKLEVVPNLSLSHPYESRRSIKWIALLRNQISASLAGSTGVHSAEDVLKLLLVGADVTMLTSVLHRHGTGHLSVILDNLYQWMSDHEYESVAQLKGSLSRENSPDPDAFARSNYMKTLSNFASTMI
jgi:dihydroorotate dehydrogenase (fumarate)